MRARSVAFRAWLRPRFSVPDDARGLTLASSMLVVGGGTIGKPRRYFFWSWSFFQLDAARTATLGDRVEGFGCLIVNEGKTSRTMEDGGQHSSRCMGLGGGGTLWWFGVGFLLGWSASSASRVFNSRGYQYELVHFGLVLE
jgi:hypothetical protein